MWNALAKKVEEGEDGVGFIVLFTMIFILIAICLISVTGFYFLAHYG